MGLTTKFAQKLTVPFSAVLSADPDNKVIPSEEAECFYTEYDGVDDAYRSSDASLKLSGYLTLCCEFRFTSSFFSYAMGNVNLSPNNGIRIETGVPGTLYWVAYCSAGTRQASQVAPSYNTGDWVKFVGICSASETAFWLDGTKCPTVASGASSVIASTTDFAIGSRPTGTSHADVDFRNIEFYNAAATTPASWVYGDGTSLGLLESNVVLRTQDGSGTDNEQGLTFTKYGDPQTLECP